MPTFKQKQQVNALIQTFQSGLIPEPDKQDLIQLVKKLPDDDRQVCQEIDKWLKEESRVKILTAYEQKLQAIVVSNAAKKTTEQGPGGTKQKTPPNQPGESLKELLENGIEPISQPVEPSVPEEE
jgi:hypothetical protein